MRDSVTRSVGRPSATRPHDERPSAATIRSAITRCSSPPLEHWIDTHWPAMFVARAPGK